MTLQDALPLDLSAAYDPPNTLVLTYEACVVAMRDYLRNQADAVLAVYLRLLRDRPGTGEGTAWNIAQRSVMAGCMHRAAGWPPPLSQGTEHLRLDEDPMLTLTDMLLSGVTLQQLQRAQYAIEEDPDD